MGERAILSAVLLLGLAIALAGLRRWQLRRANAAQDQVLAGRTLVYFWSTRCAQCEHGQKPILQRLEDVTLISHNAIEAPALAQAWGVTTVPTTFIIGTDGVARHVNNGLASEAVLRRQLGLPAVAAQGPA